MRWKREGGGAGSGVVGVGSGTERAIGRTAKRN